MTTTQSEAINAIADELYQNAVSKGFHDYDGVTNTVELFSKWVANLHGEVSELWEAARKGQLYKQCDKDVPLTCAEEEFADIFIRCCDSAKAFGIDLGRAVALKAAYNAGREHMHGKLA